MIKAADGRGMIMILDPVRLVDSEFGAGGQRADQVRGGEAAVEAEQAVDDNR